MIQQDKNRLNINIKKACEVVWRGQENIETTYHRLVTNKLQTILADETHPLRPEFDNRQTDRSDRLRLTRTRTTRYQQFFIPGAIRTHNQYVGRCSRARMQLTGTGTLMMRVYECVSER